MNTLNQLYQEVILDHNRHPRNFRKIDETSFTATGFNPLCGDQVTIYATVQQDTIQDISFQGQGCAISVASASLMTEVLRGKTLAEAQALFDLLHASLTSDAVFSPTTTKLQVLAGVKDYPARIKCATLAWHAGIAAIQQHHQEITTE